MRVKSLALRLALSSAFVSLILLVFASVLLAQLFQDALQRNFDARLRAVLDGLLANVEVDASGNPAMQGQLADTRFTLPLSGWYWQVTPPPGSGLKDLASGSLLEKRLTPPADAKAQRGADGVASFDLTDDKGNNLRAIEQAFQLPGSDKQFSFLVSGNFDELRDEAQAFRRALYLIMALLGTGLLAAVLVQVRFGLKPLQSMQASLTQIREGRSDRLQGEYPSEVQPVADELNLLIQSNSEIIERARTQVGNLAHALKTPLSVLTNEAKAKPSPLASKVSEQVEIMRDQVNLYLDRARRAARAQGLGAVTEVEPVLQALARTLKRIHRDKDLNITVTCEPGLKFRGERQDLEEVVGNLMDNATKWAAAKVHIEAAQLREVPADGRSWLMIVVDDDGPGLPPDKRAEAVQRGKRLDESKPGSGLGLSIVTETAGMYGGQLDLADTPLGGLRARLRLPAAG